MLLSLLFKRCPHLFQFHQIALVFDCFDLEFLHVTLLLMVLALLFLQSLLEIADLVLARIRRPLHFLKIQLELHNNLLRLVERI